MDDRSIQNFRDIDKYLIIAHLINKTLETYNKYYLIFLMKNFI